MGGEMRAQKGSEGHTCGLIPSNIEGSK